MAEVAGSNETNRIRQPRQGGPDFLVAPADHGSVIATAMPGGVHLHGAPPETIRERAEDQSAVAPVLWQRALGWSAWPMAKWRFKEKT